jgi:hypothetical protein
MSLTSIMVEKITKDNKMMDSFSERKNNVLKHLLFCFKNN